MREASAALAVGRFSDCMREWNGFFSVVVWQRGRIGFAVDRTRSIPLFYALDGKRVIIADSANWIRQRIGNPSLDPVRKAEFLVAGLVLNDATLCQAVHQIQSGEAISGRFSAPNGRWMLDSVRYRIFKPCGSNTAGYEELLARYDHVLTNSFKRALAVAHGRPILVPLSSGYDSRLLLLMLKRLGAKDITAYSYGPKQEVDCAQRVASNLGVSWRLLDYSQTAWHQAAKDGNFWRYVTEATNLCAIACIQEWLATRQLKLSGDFDSDVVVMPGYAADVPAGSFITMMGRRDRKLLTSRSAFENLLVRNRLSEWPMQRFTKEVRDGILRDVGRSIESLGEVSDWLAAYDSWTHGERLAKFIVNGLRAVESNEWDWWLPFLDDEFLAFWEQVPLEFRLGERLHCDFTDRLYTSMTGVPPPPRQGVAKYSDVEVNVCWATGRQMAVQLLRALYNSQLAKPIRNWRRRQGAILNYCQNPMGWYGVFPEHECVSVMINGASGINSLLCAKYLELVSERTT